LTILLGATLSGCSVESKPANKNDQRPSDDGSDPEPVPADKGRLSLKMPKPVDQPYRTLHIRLEKSACSSQPNPQPVPIEVDADQEAGTCSSESFEQDFSYSEDDPNVAIDDLVPGGYSLYVSLIDDDGNTIEEGYGWADVAPGVVSKASVELYPAQGNGRLDIDILRGGDRITCQGGVAEKGLPSEVCIYDEQGRLVGTAMSDNTY
jgi:hypothetical protein